MRIVRFVLVTAFGFITLTAAAASPARKIPGITIKDSYPQACVDCHTGRAGMPVALSARMKAWSEKVDAKQLATSQASAPKGMTLKGKHPNTMAILEHYPRVVKEFLAGRMVPVPQGNTDVRTYRKNELTLEMRVALMQRITG